MFTLNELTLGALLACLAIAGLWQWVEHVNKEENNE